MLLVERADEMMVALAAYGIFGDSVPYASAVDRGGKVTQAYGVGIERLPVIFVLDRAGRVRYIGYEKDVNAQLERTGSDIDRVVGALLKETERDAADLQGVKGFSPRCGKGRS